MVRVDEEQKRIPRTRKTPASELDSTLCTYESNSDSLDTKGTPVWSRNEPMLRFRVSLIPPFLLEFVVFVFGRAKNVASIGSAFGNTYPQYLYWVFILVVDVASFVSIVTVNIGCNLIAKRFRSLKLEGRLGVRWLSLLPVEAHWARTFHSYWHWERV